MNSCCADSLTNSSRIAQRLWNGLTKWERSILIQKLEVHTHAQHIRARATTIARFLKSFAASNRTRTLNSRKFGATIILSSLYVRGKQSLLHTTGMFSSTERSRSASINTSASRLRARRDIVFMLPRRDRPLTKSLIDCRLVCILVPCWYTRKMNLPPRLTWVVAASDINVNHNNS